MTIEKWLLNTSEHFRQNQIETAWLDALIILETFSSKNREWLLAHNDESLASLLTIDQLENIVKAVARRANHEPIAYIIGHKEFYGLNFVVDNNVLIPRPESEAIIDLLDDLGPIAGKSLVDVGTGSGALAISAKLTYKRLKVTALDISDDALAVAKINAKLLKADILFIKSNLLDEIKLKQDFILANLPYVPPDYQVSKEVEFEPARAVFTESGGLHLIEELIRQCAKKLNPGGYVLLESLPSQMKRIIETANKHDLIYVKRSGLVQVFRYWN
jgi:release factor glutamine methyltransferase